MRYLELLFVVALPGVLAEELADGRREQVQGVARPDVRRRLHHGRQDVAAPEARHAVVACRTARPTRTGQSDARSGTTLPGPELNDV